MFAVVLPVAQVLAGLPDEQRAAVLAARAEGALDLQDGEGDLDEVGGKFTVHSLLRVKFTDIVCNTARAEGALDLQHVERVTWTRWVGSSQLPVSGV
jgi:hypothetical protein